MVEAELQREFDAWEQASEEDAARFDQLEIIELVEVETPQR